MSIPLDVSIHTFPKMALFPPFERGGAESARPEDFKIPRPTATPFMKGRIRGVDTYPLTRINLVIRLIMGRGRVELPSSYERQLLRLVRFPIPPPAQHSFQLLAFSF